MLGIEPVAAGSRIVQCFQNVNRRSWNLENIGIWGMNIKILKRLRHFFLLSGRKMELRTALKTLSEKLLLGSPDRFRGFPELEPSLKEAFDLRARSFEAVLNEFWKTNDWEFLSFGNDGLFSFRGKLLPWFCCSGKKTIQLNNIFFLIYDIQSDVA